MKRIGPAWRVHKRGSGGRTCGTSRCKAMWAATSARWQQGGKSPTHSRAGLDEELADRRAVIHGVEGGDFVNAHRWHLEDAGDLVHDADGREAVLALAEVEDRHDGGLLILRRIALQELGDDLLVLLGELEGDIGVVVLRVAVLRREKRALAERLPEDP